MVMCVGIWMCWSTLYLVRNSMGDVVCCLDGRNPEAFGLSLLVWLFCMTLKIGNSLSKFLCLCLMLVALWFMLFHGDAFCCGAVWLSYIIRVGDFDVNPLFLFILIILLVLFFSLRLFLIYFLPSRLGILKGGFLISSYCMLFRWASWCNYGCSVDNPVCRAFLLCFVVLYRYPYRWCPRWLVEILGRRVWVCSLISLMFWVGIVASCKESPSLMAFVTWMVRINASSFIWADMDILTTFIMSTRISVIMCLTILRQSLPLVVS